MKPEEVFSFIEDALERFFQSEELSADVAKHLTASEVYLWFVLSLFDELLIISSDHGTLISPASMAVISSSFEAFRPRGEARINEFRSEKRFKESLH